MLFNTRSLIVAALVLAVTCQAHAQVCREDGTAGTGKANLKCDMSYRNAVIACDKVNDADTNEVLGTRPACPPKPMPMITTPKSSYIVDYTPYLFAYPRDAKDPSRPYAGAYVVGTPGDASKTFQMFGNTAPGTKRMAACTAQIKIPKDPTSIKDEAKLNRLQLDNCTNQYILNSAIYPYQKESTTRLLSGEDPKKPAKPIELKSECQPLKTFQETKGEYRADTYLKAAWTKMMQDPGYRKTVPSLVKYVPCYYLDVNHTLGLDNIPCDREPHLPKGVTLDNPTPPPNELKNPKQEFPEVLLSSIAAVPYEEIVDPTHPFSPRWDFMIADRDYSNFTPATALNPTALAVYGMLQIYMSKTENSVFCAGVKKEDKETDAQKKADAVVPVDVLEFRRPAFEKALRQRALYNSACKMWPAMFTGGKDALFYVLPFSFCYQITGFSMFYPWIYAKDFACWECFGLNGKVDDEQQHPPCTHNYLGKDLTMKKLPGGLNGLKRAANCGTKMSTVCKDLRKPYTQLNKLKMRYHNPDDKDDKEFKNAVLKAGALGKNDVANAALEGMTFKEYFGNHMPYPKLWDIGSSLQMKSSSDGNNQPPLDTTGQYTAIVGVGREAVAKAAVENAKEDEDGLKPEDKYTDQRCKTGGWGGILGVPLPADLVSLGGDSYIYLPDPVSSWTETKLYQTRTMRQNGMSCIGRYEKVFKPGSAENLILMASGAEWSKLIVTKCSKDKNGRTKDDCTYMTLKEFVDAGNPKTDDATLYMKQLTDAGWPFSWRGYAAAGGVDITDKDKFPNFAKGSSLTLPSLGLDDAKVGDVILMPFGPKNDPLTPGLAKLALVIQTQLPGNSDCVNKKNCFVKVLEPDNGKFPDVCGTTDTWGEMKTRYYFKPGMLPEQAAAEYKKIKSTSNCVETRILQCEQSAWSSLQLYRIKKDRREGCKNKPKAANCTKDEKK